MSLQRHDLHQLTGAYAADALTGAELAEFEKHLGHCPSCAEEVRGLRETAARLGIATSIVPPPAMRRQVLEALLASHKPLGAYEIIERLADKSRPAPITIYRALDFLRENGLVHRIESRNAFMACVHNHADDDLVVFLICERCGSVGEIPAAPVAQGLNAAARATGFAPKMSVVEITGVCAHCQN